MLMNTSRFGKVQVDDQRVITFAKGILGFPKQKHYVLLQSGEDSCFYWLQAVDRADLAFVVTDPSLFVDSYRVPIKAEQLGGLGMDSVDDAQVFVIVNKREQALTGNLQGPLIVNVRHRVGEQMVLSDRRYTTRVPLIELDGAAEAVEQRSAVAVPA